ncbi:hypothetical protein HZU40_11875 [Mycolicibacterium fluoranthenivorans]|uniref:Uncharacterized protein n=1 Tax=Mycolicibacterium fluoranthenivorans TaxID=258505 RepID=A0A7G8PKL1_9MYCO|nr:hypothetical protein [Mycolicibacterium fluoranthenivorans]QNJ94877.1 hypothetical protein HZU40_11875 [Mycolicibacterium fluoranthenivorans]
MSHISDRLPALPLAEQQRWRRELDLLTENACGCRSAAATLTTASIFSAVTIARADHRPKTAVQAICLTLSATVLSKIAAQLKASEREKQMSAILDQRIAEVAHQQS